MNLDISMLPMCDPIECLIVGEFRYPNITNVFFLCLGYFYITLNISNNFLPKDLKLLDTALCFGCLKLELLKGGELGCWAKAASGVV